MNHQNLATFQETLRSTLHIAQEFSELLADEKKQLTSTKRESINSLLPRKQQLINELAQHQQAILTFCQQSEIEPTYGAMRSYLYRIGVENAEFILMDWVELKNSLIKNQAMNKTNEAILNELIRRNRIKQSIVRNLGRESNTYSARGQRQNQAAAGWVEQV